MGRLEGSGVRTSSSSVAVSAPYAPALQKILNGFFTFSVDPTGQLRGSPMASYAIGRGDGEGKWRGLRHGFGGMDAIRP